MDTRRQRWLYGIALLLAVVPLWVGEHLPMVDLPQHLMLISALHRLHDPTTVYPHLFEVRPELTPYLGYYWIVALLNWVFPLGIANKLFLSAYVVGMPLGLAFLLKSLGRPVWPSLLAIPFAYGDSFAWGFVNYVAAMPLAFLSLGLFVRAITDPARRVRWSLWHGPVLVAVLLFHVQVFGFLAFALPFLLLTTRAPEDRSAGPEALKRRLLARVPAIASVLPGVALFLIWVVGRVGAPAEIAPGQPWKAWGPMLSAQNLSYKSFAQNKAELFQVLANQLRDGSDRYAVYLAFGLAAAAALLALAGQREKSAEGPVERWRMLGLSAIALALYFTLPFDIRGYVYYLNTRFAHLWAALLVASAPALTLRLKPWAVAAGALVALVTAVPLARGFAAFDDEAKALDQIALSAPDHPMVMGLIFDTGSRVVSHPVFLHAAAIVAQERGGATNFTFALTPHSPLRYQREPPPTFPSEWHPEGFVYPRMAGAYDAFLVRGPSPAQIFGGRLQSEVQVVAHEGDFWLVDRL